MPVLGSKPVPCRVFMCNNVKTAKQIFMQFVVLRVSQKFADPLQNILAQGRDNASAS
jgi:hypothetical protein